MLISTDLFLTLPYLKQSQAINIPISSVTTSLTVTPSIITNVIFLSLFLLIYCLYKYAGSSDNKVIHLFIDSSIHSMRHSH